MIKLIFRQFEISISHITGECAYIPFSSCREVESVSANQRPWQPSCFFDRPKKTNFVEDVVKFRQTLFSGSREVLTVSTNQRQGPSSLFSDQPEKHKLLGRWDCVPCQVLLNSVQQFQRISRKHLSQSREPIRVFTLSPKNTNVIEDVDTLIPVHSHWILFASYREEVENVSATRRPGRPIGLSDQHQKHKLGQQDIEILFPVRFRWIPFDGNREVRSYALKRYFEH